MIFLPPRATQMLTLDKLAATNASASYTGHAIGNVASNIDGNWKTYVAAGNLNMQWNFGPRQGNLAISNFDANGPKGPLNVSGQMSTPGVLTNQFGGNLSGTLGAREIAGSATGSFVNNGPSNPAAGVLGNFNVGSNSNGYKATGIFRRLGHTSGGHTCQLRSTGAQPRERESEPAPQIAPPPARQAAWPPRRTNANS